MTKGSGVFVLPPHITKMGAKTFLGLQSKHFGFSRESWLEFAKEIEGGKKGNAILFWVCIDLQMLDAWQERRDEVGWGWKAIILSPISPFLISVTVNFKDTACHKYPQMTKMQSCLSHMLSLTSQFLNCHSIWCPRGWNMKPLVQPLRPYQATKLHSSDWDISCPVKLTTTNDCRCRWEHHYYTLFSNCRETNGKVYSYETVEWKSVLL